MTGYVYDAEGTRVAKGTLQNMNSCDPPVNGFQTTSDYVLGPSGEQVTEVDVDADGNMARPHTNVWAGGKLLATYDNNGLHFYLDDPLGTRRVRPTTPAYRTDMRKPSIRRRRKLHADSHRTPLHRQRTRYRIRQ